VFVGEVDLNPFVLSLSKPVLSFVEGDERPQFVKA
jgi:hypothetical protein